MPETARGIVYPVSGDHTRLWEHYQNLAETTDAAIGDAVPDTGWKNWTTGVPTGYTIRTRQIGPTMWISVVGNADVPTGSTTIATSLPGGVAGAWQGCSLNYYSGLITVSSGGNLVVRNQTGAARSNCNALYTYPV